MASEEGAERADDVGEEAMATEKGEEQAGAAEQSKSTEEKKAEDVEMQQADKGEEPSKEGKEPEDVTMQPASTAGGSSNQGKEAEEAPGEQAEPSKSEEAKEEPAKAEDATSKQEEAPKAEEAKEASAKAEDVEMQATSATDKPPEADEEAAKPMEDSGEGDGKDEKVKEEAMPTEAGGEGDGKDDKWKDVLLKDVVQDSKSWEESTGTKKEDAAGGKEDKDEAMGEEDKAKGGEDEEKKDGEEDGSWKKEDSSWEEKGENEEGGEEAEKQEEVDSEEEEDWKALPKFDIGWEDAVWFLEDEGKRVKALQELGEVEVKVRPSGKLRMRPRASAGDAELGRWPEQCMKAMCAMRAGTDLEIYPLPSTSSTSPPLTVVEVPAEVPATFIKGKNGARMNDLCQELNVVAAFAVQGTPPPGEEPPEEEKKEKPWEPGMKVEGKYGAEWFEAELLEVGDVVVKVKWGFDESEEEVVRSNVKLIEPPPEDPPGTVLIFGGTNRGRMEMELRLMGLMELKVPGCTASRPKRSDDCEGTGWTHTPLTLEGKALGRLIGKGGVVRKRIAKIFSSALEYCGSFAHVVGTKEERDRTVSVLELMQASDTQQIKAVPENLEALCTRLSVQKEAASGITGQRRSNLTYVEDATGTLIFSQPPRSQRAGAPQTRIALQEGSIVEGRCKGEWFEAKVMKVDDWAADSDEDDDTDGRTVTLKWTRDGKEAVVPITAVRECLDGAAAEERKRQEELATQTTFVIFGDERSRVLAKLRIMDLVEGQKSGTYTASKLEKLLGARVQPLQEEEVTRCQKDEVAARLATAGTAAGNCVVGLVGRNLCLLGNADACARGEQFIRPLLVEKPTTTEVDGFEANSHSILLVPKAKSANFEDKALEPIESEFQVFVYSDDGANLAGIEDEIRLVICGHDAAKRAAAMERLEKLAQAEPEEGGGEQSWDDKQNWEEKKDWDDQGAKDEKSWEEKDQGKKKSDWDEKKDEKKDWDKKEEKQEWGSDKKKDWGDDKKKDWGGGGEKKDWGGEKKDWGGGGGKKDWEEKKDWGGDKKDWGSDKKDWGSDKKDWGSDKKDWGGDKKDWEEKKDWGSEKKDWGEKKDARGQKRDWEEKKEWAEEKSWGEKKSWDDKKGWDEKKSWDEKDSKWGGDKKQSWEDKKSSWNEESKDDKGWGEKNWQQSSKSWDDNKGSRNDDRSWDAKSSWGGGKEWEQKSSRDNREDDKRGRGGWGHGREAEEEKSWDQSRSSQSRKRGWPEEDRREEKRNREEWRPRCDRSIERHSERRDFDHRSRTEPLRPGRVDPDMLRGHREDRKRDSHDMGEPDFPPRFAKWRRPEQQASPAPWRPSGSSQATSSFAGRQSLGRPAPPRTVPPRVMAPRIQPLRPAPPAGPPPMNVYARRQQEARAEEEDLEDVSPLEEEEEDRRDGGRRSQSADGSRPWAPRPSESNEQADPPAVLAKLGRFPESVEEWSCVQEVVFENHPPLPDGWIRVWSRSQECEYYMRTEDNFSTFELDEVE